MHKYFLICLCLLTACRAELPEDPSEALSPVAFEAEAETTTRILDTLFEEGDIVGIVPTDQRNLYDKYRRYVAHSNASGGNTFSLHPEETDPLRYPDLNTSVAFMAFAPYKLPIDRGYEGAVTYDVSDQSTLEKQKACDHVYAFKTANYKQSDGKTVKLLFYHIFTKIRISLSEAVDDNPDFRQATIRLLNMPTAIRHDMCLAPGRDDIDGGLEGVLPAGTITPYTVRQTPSLMEAEAIVMPNDYTANFKDAAFSFTFGGNTYTVSFQDAGIRQLEKGKSYGFDFVLVGNKIQLRGATINEWDHQYDFGGSQDARTNQSLFQIPPAGATQTLVITTTSSATPAFQAPQWVTIDAAKINSTRLPNGDYQWRVPFYAPRNATGIIRSEYLVTTIDNFTLPVKVTQEYASVIDGLANCYILHKEQSIDIPISRAYTHGGYSGAASDLRLQIQLLNNQNVLDLTHYIEIVGGNDGVTGAGKDAYFTVIAKDITDESYGSNYRIVLRGDNAITGPIYWSWHIWMTEYDPYDEYTTRLGHGSWPNDKYPAHYVPAMTRNLGQITPIYELNTIGQYGLYYQWGRKDPFAFKGEGINLDMMSRPVTIETTIRQPEKFVLGSRSDTDWLATKNDTLWSNNGKKTVFDPCPDGWRVPQSDPWVGATYVSYDGDGKPFTGPLGTGGIGCALQYDSQDRLFFPSSGIYAGDTSARPTLWKNGGGLWTGSVSGAKARSLYFYFNTESQRTPKLSDRNRFEGNNVRCVKDNL
jgi:hypothetical protein